MFSSATQPPRRPPPRRPPPRRPPPRRPPPRRPPPRRPPPRRPPPRRPPPRRPPPRRPPPRHNFVVSAITFEGFKLRSHLTHALFIQIYRTSSITDIVVAYRSEMAITVIESYFRTSKMAAGDHFVQNLKK